MRIRFIRLRTSSTSSFGVHYSMFSFPWEYQTLNIECRTSKLVLLSKRPLQVAPTERACARCENRSTAISPSFLTCRRSAGTEPSLLPPSAASRQCEEQSSDTSLRTGLSPTADFAPSTIQTSKLLLSHSVSLNAGFQKYCCSDCLVHVEKHPAILDFSRLRWLEAEASSC